jgi:hypothetical protein
MIEWQDIRGDCRDQDQRSEQVDNSYTQNATKVVSTGVRVVSPDEAGYPQVFANVRTRQKEACAINAEDKYRRVN